MIPRGRSGAGSVRCLGTHCLAIPALAAGCGVGGILGGDGFVLYVAPQTVECVGVDVQQCMLTRRSESEEWTYFYGEIRGFTYEPGYEWTLRVKTRHIANPPADGSSIEYRLLEVIQKAGWTRRADASPAPGPRPPHPHPPSAASGGTPVRSVV